RRNDTESSELPQWALAALNRVSSKGKKKTFSHSETDTDDGSSSSDDDERRRNKKKKKRNGKIIYMGIPGKNRRMKRRR
mgnify:CR=1